jgi:ribonuclease P protein component
MEKLIPICENRDFRRIYARGKSVVTPQIVIYISKNRQKTLRIGITTSKKIGNAVMRNRSRRIIREAFREISPQIKRGYDIILVARGKTPYLKSTDVKNQLIRQLSKEKLFVNAELTGDVNI